jgi:hypothetical protein
VREQKQGSGKYWFWQPVFQSKRHAPRNYIDVSTTAQAVNATKGREVSSKYNGKVLKRKRTIGYIQLHTVLQFSLEYHGPVCEQKQVVTTSVFANQPAMRTLASFVCLYCLGTFFCAFPAFLYSVASALLLSPVCLRSVISFLKKVRKKRGTVKLPGTVFWREV